MQIVNFIEPARRVSFGRVARSCDMDQMDAVASAVLEEYPHRRSWISCFKELAIAERLISMCLTATAIPGESGASAPTATSGRVASLCAVGALEAGVKSRSCLEVP